MVDTQARLTIGEVARRTGMSVHALRLYEREGLLAGPVRRESNGHRAYSEWDVEWLSYCTKFRASGMPLATIRRFAELVRSGPGNEDERLELLRDHQRVVEGRIAELTDCLDVIANKVRIYETHRAEGTAADLWAHRA
jgi:DNA-binding transcriptional MerR regulator